MKSVNRKSKTYSEEKILLGNDEAITLQVNNLLRKQLMETDREVIQQLNNTRDNIRKEYQSVIIPMVNHIPLSEDNIEDFIADMEICKKEAANAFELRDILTTNLENTTELTKPITSIGLCIGGYQRLYRRIFITLPYSNIYIDIIHLSWHSYFERHQDPKSNYIILTSNYCNKMLNQH